MNDESMNENELDVLKQRADKMGISYHPSIGVEKLKAKVDDVLNDEGDAKDSEKEDSISKEAPKKSLAPSKQELKRLYHTRLRKEANKLIRVRVTCMNPNKKNWTGKIFSVSNRVIGTIKKFVPYNLEEGYHIPTVIYDMMKARQYQHFSQVRLPNGQKKAVTKLLPEFNLEVMEPLTKKQLDDLKQRQILNNSID